MNRTQSILVALIVLAAILAGYLLLGSSEEDKVKSRLDELSEIVSSTDASGILGKAKIISSFQDLFANPVVLDTNYRQAQGIYTPKALAGAYLGFIQSGRRIEISFRSTTIDLVSPTQASALTEADVSIFLNQEMEQDGSGSLEIKFIKTQDSDWVIEGVRSR